MKHSTPAVIALLVANAALFALTYLVPGQMERMSDLFALHFPQNESFRVWQLVSHIFMHGSLGHIFFNMFALFTFGGPLERAWGARRFLVFYFAAGIGAGIIYTGINVVEFGWTYNSLISNGASADEIGRFLYTARIEPGYLAGISEEETGELLRNFHGSMVGASGAIYGVLVAFALLYPNAKLALLFLPVPIAAKIFVPILLLMDLFSGITGFSLFGGGIAHFAHIGGAIIGFLLMLYWRNTLQEDPGRRFD